MVDTDLTVNVEFELTEKVEDDGTDDKAEFWLKEVHGKCKCGSFLKHMDFHSNELECDACSRVWKISIESELIKYRI